MDKLVSTSGFWDDMDTFSDWNGGGSSADGALNAPKGERFVSLEAIKKKVTEITAERKSLGPPAQKFGYIFPPSGQHCPYCKREFCTARQPLRGRDCPHLEVARAGSPVCLCCRNCQNWCMKGKDKKVLLSELSCEKAFFRYTILVFIWEDRFNNPQMALVRTVEELPFNQVTKVFAQESIEIASELELGILWPSGPYVKKFQKQIPKRQIRIVTINSQKVRGAILEPEFGNPIGTYHLKQIFKTGALKSIEAERSDKSARGSHATDDAFKGLQDRFAVSVTPGDGTDESSATIRQQHLVPTGADADDDPLDMIWNPVFSTKGSGSSSKRAFAASGVSGTESAAEALDPPGTRTPTKKGKCGEKRIHEFNTSEQVLLKAQHMLAEIEQSTNLSPAKLNTVLSALRSRSTDKMIQLYAQEVDDPLQAGAGRSAIRIMSVLRSLLIASTFIAACAYIALA